MADSDSTDPNPEEWELPSARELIEMLPQYDIVDLLGRGGMGAVFKGRQAKLDRDVAIKLLFRSAVESDEEMKFSDRFQQEAKAMAKLDHPNIVSVHDFGETHDGQLYLVMEYIDGMDIQQYLAHHGGSLPQEHALSITAHVLDALGYAHSHGIVHRDIKPANILLNHEGRVKIADFGLAKKFGIHADETDPSLTMTNMAVGTPDFLAPEALEAGMEVDHRADLYAVGVMLYQMLTGKVPRGVFKMPSELNSNLDQRLDKILMKAMEADPEHRYLTAADVRTDIDKVISQPISKVNMEDGPVTTQKSRSKPALFGAVVIILLVIVATGAFIFNKNQNNSVGDNDVEGIADQNSRVFVSDPIIANASQDSPFENSLGMRFVPVPITGGALDSQSILFSIWETRRGDYQNFIQKHPERAWPDPHYESGYEITNDHPASMVSWEDAQEFAKWLTEDERKKGLISDKVVYRLPSDHEWSCAIGIGKEEDAQASPDSKHMKVIIYPWGSNYPPLGKAGNYYGEEMNAKLIDDRRVLAGYNDGFVRLAPVGQFSSNQFGLYDMGGNLWEWCEDLNTQAEDKRVLRGASWLDQTNTKIYSSARLAHDPAREEWAIGFRLVLAPVLAE